MPNLTSVGISSGIPNSGTGTVSTIDNIPALWDKGAGTGGSLTQRTIIDSSQLGTLGAATAANSVPMTVATNQATIAFAYDLTKIANGVTGTNLTPKFSTISCSSAGANTIITPTAGTKVYVIQWIVSPNAAVNFKWQTQTGPTDITGLFYCTGQGNGYGAAFNPVGHFHTSTNSDTLILNLSGAVAVGGSLVYVEV